MTKLDIIEPEVGCKIDMWHPNDVVLHKTVIAKVDDRVLLCSFDDDGYYEFWYKISDIKKEQILYAD